MAFTYSDFKKSLRGLFGAKQTRSSGDGGGDVLDHTARLSQRYVTTRFASNATATNTWANSAVFVAQEECDVVGLRIVIDAALTTTATDYVVLNVVKRKATSFSLTENVATLNLGQTSAWTVNSIGTSKAFTLATTASVIDMDAGDSLCINAALAGANVTGNPACLIQVAVEEK
jgi:hypothetical protein